MPIDPDVALFGTPGFFYDKLVHRASGSFTANPSTVGPLALGQGEITLTNPYGKKMPVFVQVSVNNLDWYLFVGPYGDFSLDFYIGSRCTDSEIKLFYTNGIFSSRTIYYRLFGVHLWPN